MLRVQREDGGVVAAGGVVLRVNDAEEAWRGTGGVWGKNGPLLENARSWRSILVRRGRFCTAPNGKLTYHVGKPLPCPPQPRPPPAPGPSGIGIGRRRGRLPVTFPRTRPPL